MPRVSERVAPARRYRATREYPELQSEMRARGLGLQELAAAAGVSRATLHLLTRGARSHHPTIERIRTALAKRAVIVDHAPTMTDAEAGADEHQEPQPCNQTE